MSGLHSAVQYGAVHSGVQGGVQGSAQGGVHYVYWFVFILMVIGLYMVISHGNLVKKLIGLNVFQIGVFMFYIALGKVEGGRAPIIEKGVSTYSHPLPHVLILTAIVVGIATTSLGLALAIRIYEAYGTIEEDEAVQLDEAAERDENTGRDGAAGQGGGGRAS